MNTLVVFDVDDTLFTTNCLVDIIDAKTGKIIDRIAGRDFDHENFAKGHEFGFDDYRCAVTFSKSQPIAHMIGIAKSHMANPNDTVAFVTARCQIDDIKMYIDTFHKTGLHINKTDVIFAGGSNRNSGMSSHDLKRPVFEKLLRQNIWNQAIVYDDNAKNLKVFRELAFDVDVPCKGYLIQDDVPVRIY